MQIETLLNEKTEDTIKLMSKPTTYGKVNISLSKLFFPTLVNNEIAVLQSVSSFNFDVTELEKGSILVEQDGVAILPARPVLRDIASKINVPILKGNGNPFNTRQLGSLIKQALGFL